MEGIAVVTQEEHTDTLQEFFFSSYPSIQLSQIDE